MTSGPLEERGRHGRWASGNADAIAFHLTGLNKQDEELWTKTYKPGMAHSWLRTAKGHLSKMGKNAVTQG